MAIRQRDKNRNGFTLIEVMLVVALIGLTATLVQFSFSSNGPEELLKKASARFAGIFDVAAEYSMLNNIEIGLFIEEDHYQFLGYDGVRWSEIPNHELFAVHALAEGVEIELQLDDLPIEEAQLFDASTFVFEDDEDFDAEATKKVIPQVYILSGGDITPFSVIFSLAENGYFEQDLTYKVTGLYSTPVSIEGPLYDGIGKANADN
ncbi:type II secretion system minor pseudopilin GspH [Colwelliaceae bacterium 6471]